MVTRPPISAHRHRRGLASVWLLAVLLGLGALAASSLVWITQAEAESTQHADHQRAALAAQAGLAWAQRLMANAASTDCPTPRVLQGLPGQLSRFVVQVDCQHSPEGRRLQAVACMAQAPMADRICRPSTPPPGYVQASRRALLTLGDFASPAPPGAN